MSFLVVNTGRAASRALYLNFKRQRGAVCLRRHQLDHAIGRFTRRGRPGPLRELVEAYRMAAAVRRDSVPCLVFHDARSRLLFPYDQPRNEQVLAALRDELGVRVVFLLVRDPRSMVLSELNRSLARRVGDWAFPVEDGAWRGTFTFEELAAEPGAAPAPRPAPSFGLDELCAMTVADTERTGKVHALFQLFRRVFDDVRFVDYEDLLARPVETYAAMAALGGLSFDDPSLAHTKLNSLSNRLLLANPIQVACPGPARRRLFDRRRAPVRYRLELSAVLPLCDDWGHYEPLTDDCSRELEAVEADCGSRLSLGVSAEDLAPLSRAEAEVLRSPSTARAVLAGAGPRFAAEYRRAREFFRQLYLRELPEPVFEAFWARNGAEYAALQAERERGALVAP